MADFGAYRALEGAKHGQRSETKSIGLDVMRSQMSVATAW
jgi:hypothetical protein